MRRLRHFFTVRLNWVALLIVGFFFTVALAAPWIAPPDDPAHPAPYRYLEGQTQVAPLPPGPGLPLGTVAYMMDSTGGRELLHFDIFYSLVWGTRTVLRFGLLTALAAACLGITLGAIGGYVGGALNFALMRITDAFLAFPVIAGVWLFRTVMQTANMELVDYTNLTPVSIPSTLSALVLTWASIGHVDADSVFLDGYAAYQRQSHQPEGGGICTGGQSGGTAALRISFVTAANA
jgi:ABC-type dipeptide/oligopeptide/nickel transport system permease subunit